MAKRDPIQEYLAEIGRKGGQAKVPKGLATLTPEERRQRAKEGAKARWAKTKKPAAKKAKGKT
jgi:hypothetical protein